MKQARILTADEYKRVLAVIDSLRYGERNRAIFQLSFLGGMRACEICSLKLGDVVDERFQVKGQFVLDKDMTKGSERNRVIVGSALHKALQRYVDQLGKKSDMEQPCIQSQKGGHFKPITIVQLFAKFYKKAGISGASSHSGRRQYITALAENQVNARVIQALARHKHINTTMRYIDINDVKLQKAVELVVI